MAERSDPGAPVVEHYSIGSTRALPNFVRTEEDKSRWENSLKVAAMAHDLPDGHEVVWSTAQVLYHDRVTYPS